MATLRIRESHLAGDLHGVLAKVREGVEVIIEEDHRPVVRMQAHKRAGRPISKGIASAQASGSPVTLDGDFANDVEQGIKERAVPAPFDSARAVQ